MNAVMTNKIISTVLVDVLSNIRKKIKHHGNYQTIDDVMRTSVPAKAVP
jgi:hypothetical protein